MIDFFLSAQFGVGVAFGLLLAMIVLSAALNVR